MASGAARFLACGALLAMLALLPACQSARDGAGVPQKQCVTRGAGRQIQC